MQKIYISMFMDLKGKIIFEDLKNNSVEEDIRKHGHFLNIHDFKVNKIAYIWGFVTSHFLKEISKDKT